MVCPHFPSQFDTTFCTNLINEFGISLSTRVDNQYKFSPITTCVRSHQLVQLMDVTRSSIFRVIQKLAEEQAIANE